MTYTRPNKICEYLMTGEVLEITNEGTTRRAIAQEELEGLERMLDSTQHLFREDGTEYRVPFSPIHRELLYRHVEKRRSE